MPVVPEATRQVAISDRPAPEQNISMPVGASGLATLGEGLQSLGEAEQGAANTFAKRAIEMATVDNHASATQAASDFTVAKGHFLNDDNGIYSQQGKNAVDAVPAALEGLQKLADTYSSALSNPQAKEFFSATTDRELQYTQDQIFSFAAGQRRKYVADTYDSGIQTAQLDAFQNRNDPAAFDNSMGNVLAAQAAKDHFEGVSPQRGALNALAVKSATYTSVIERTLAAGQPLEAEAMRAAHENDLMPDDAIKLAASLRAPVAAEQSARGGDAVVDEVLNGTPTLPNVSGPQYAQIRTDLEAAGATPTETGYLLRNAQFESRGRMVPGERADVYGTWQFKEATFRRYLPNGDFHSQADQAKAALLETRDYASTLASKGIEADEGNLYVMHQQGIGGGPALLTAPPGMNALQAVAPFYPNLKRAAEAITNNGGKPFEPAAQFVAYLRTQFGGATARTGGALAQAAGTGEPVDYDGIREQVLALADQRAEAQRPGDAGFRNQFEAQALGTLSRMKSAQSASQAAAADRLISAATGGEDAAGAQIFDQAGLQKAYPGAAGDIALLSGKQRNQIFSSLRHEGNALTPERDRAYTNLRGLAVNDPVAFLNHDVIAEDLTMRDKRNIIILQQNLRAKQSKLMQANDNIRRALKDPLITSMLNEQGVKSGSDEYNQFTGSMLGQIEAYRAANNGKEPDDNTLRGYAATLMSRSGGFLGFGARSGYQVPDESSAAITAQFNQRFGRDPTLAETSAIYARTHAR